MRNDIYIGEPDYWREPPDEPDGDDWAARALEKMEAPEARARLRLCIDCRYHLELAGPTHWCCHPSTARIDPVTGEPALQPCTIERLRGPSDGDRCGPLGERWEPIEDEAQGTLL